MEQSSWRPQARHRQLATPAQAVSARAALDNADDVVIFDADVETHPFDDAPTSLVNGYIESVGWDPRDNPGTWSLLVLRPRTGHVWNGPAEIDGRTILREGHWLDA